MERKINPAQLDGVTLAYIGDCVMELYVRRLLIESGIAGSAELNHAAQQMVNAAAQARGFRRIEPLLTEEETDYYRRGRNSGHLNQPKHAKMSDYRTATGFEALLGFLSLSGREERVEQLLSECIEIPE